MPSRLVHTLLQVTEQVWHPMPLSRFSTIAICARTFMLTFRCIGQEEGGTPFPKRHASCYAEQKENPDERQDQAHRGSRRPGDARRSRATWADYRNRRRQTGVRGSFAG